MSRLNAGDHNIIGGPMGVTGCDWPRPLFPQPAYYPPSTTYITNWRFDTVTKNDAQAIEKAAELAAILERMSVGDRKHVVDYIKSKYEGLLSDA